jgi:hypothetical protein
MSAISTKGESYADDTKYQARGVKDIPTLYPIRESPTRDREQRENPVGYCHQHAKEG